MADMQRSTYAPTAMARADAGESWLYGVVDCALGLLDASGQCLGWEELLDALPPGPTGATGATGPQGPIGPQGPAGGGSTESPCIPCEHLLWDPFVHLDECMDSPPMMPLDGDVMVYRGESPGCWALEQQGGGSNNAPPPDSVSKGWIRFDGTGVISISDSWNVSTIVDIGVGNYGIYWDVDFDNADYAVTFGGESFNIELQTTNVGNINIYTRNSASNVFDYAEICVDAHGDNPIYDPAYVAPEVVDDQIIKGWIDFNGTGVIAINDSYNVSSITDRGVGAYTVTWDTDFANANYAAAFGSNAAWIFIDGGVKLTTGVQVGVATAPAFTRVDVNPITVMAIGDQ